MGIADDGETYTYTKTCPTCGLVMGDDDHSRLKYNMSNHVDKCEGMKPVTGDTTEEPVRMKPATADTTTEAPAVDTQDEPTPNLASALCEMQKSELGATTDSKNPFFNAKYADLRSVWAVIREPLTKAGLSVMQYTEDYPDGVTVVTRLYHTSGEMVESRLSGKIQPDKKGRITVQGLGSLITYLRRYSLSAMVGVAPVDDDGEGAVQNGA